MREDVVVVGSANVDHSVFVDCAPAAGETVLAAGFLQSVGGKGVNQAISVRGNGASVAFIGCVGGDPGSGLVADRLADAGIDPKYLIRRESSTTGQAWVFVASSGENSIAVSQCANTDLSVDVLRPVLEPLVSGLHRPIILLCQGEIPVDTIEFTAAFAQENGIRFVLNLAPYVPVSLQTLKQADPLIVNETEAVSLLDQLGLQGFNGLSPAQLLSREIGASVVLTQGASGARAALPDGREIVIDAEPVSIVVDTTGAGDAFVGALTASIARGAPLDVALRSGIRAGGLAVQSKGASQPQPTPNNQ